MANKDESDFMEYFEGKVSNTIREYHLLTREDNVLVAVSGGKDSTTALFILKKLGYDVEGIIIDQLLGEYSRQNLSNIEDFCSENNIKLHVIHMRDEYGYSVCYMKSVLDSKGVRLNSCTICGVIRRNILNKKARKLNATKIATGHNLDDEVQSFIMNIMQGNIHRSARLGPQSGVRRDSRFVQRIKPLYFCTEAETELYSRTKGFPVVYDPCPCSLDSYRTHVKEMINELETRYPDVKERVISGFINILPVLKDSHPDTKINECSMCGEPSSNRVCRSCSILNKLSNNMQPVRNGI